jgi:hypothetical protein
VENSSNDDLIGRKKSRVRSKHKGSEVPTNMTMGTWGDGQQAGEDSTLGRDRPVLQTR